MNFETPEEKKRKAEERRKRMEAAPNETAGDCQGLPIAMTSSSYSDSGCSDSSSSSDSGGCGGGD